MQRPLNLADVLEAMADALPDRVAIFTRDRAWTFAEIDDRSTRLANHLIGLGVRPGEHVAVHATNRIEWVDALYGCLKARAVPININYKYLRDEPGLPLRQRRLRRRDHRPRVRRGGARARRTEPAGAWSSSARATTPRSPPPPPSARSTDAAPTTTTCSTPAAPPATPRAWCGATRT
ncbi:AMP-binding protein [Nocardioides sp. W3-2-3]|uniref:AMP-binding protein n=1 Tax=Nocardioides convexus TaxID=2712224 RepID=UPI002418A355|nr:AMP-binding protein [Nocardioides convexus]NHA00449.1 AMP-binding protein [Nocardioides convexus]